MEPKRAVIHQINRIGADSSAIVDMDKINPIKCPALSFRD
jgi:hypothetical protein